MRNLRDFFVPCLHSSLTVSNTSARQLEDGREIATVEFWFWMLYSVRSVLSEQVGIDTRPKCLLSFEAAH